MKILQYNIWNGCREHERYNKLKRFLMNQSFDHVGFNELKYWTETEFAQEMNKCGYAHSVFLGMASSPYSIGFTSKKPIEVLKMTEKEPFHHGLLHIRCDDIDFIITHLSPFSAECREQETECIASYIEHIDRPLLVMGDLNTLSPLDDKYYVETRLLDSLKRTEISRRRHVKNGYINYQPMKTLLEAGLHDLGIVDFLDYSMPTKVHENFHKYKQVRIDYMLGNDQILKRGAQARIIRNDSVDLISDHYPIECQID